MGDVVPAQAGVRLESGSSISDGLAARWFEALYETPLLFSGILDDEGRVLGANRLAVEGCGLDRGETIGRPWWECGWWRRDPAVAAQIRTWCHQVLATGEPLRAGSRYFVGDGSQRYVDLALFPIRDDDGVVRIVATGADITGARSTQQHREHQLDEVAASWRRTEERLQRLAGVALELSNAETVEDLLGIVVGRGLAVIGADGGAIGIRDQSARTLQLVLGDSLEHDLRAFPRELPLDGPMPAAHVVRTGEEVLLPDREAALAWSAAAGEDFPDSGRSAWALLPLRIGAQVLGVLAVAWAEERTFAEDDLGLLRAFAAQCAQALDRVRRLQADRAAALAAQRLSETLQRSLLTQPPTPESLDIAVRYQPAAREAEVGGDWYDAFVTATGSTMLVVGDVSGHDRMAAASMGQLRNLVRGMAYDSGAGPAALLGRLDMAMRGLRLTTLATVVLALVEPRAGGRRELCWSSAGHPPPLLRDPEGGVEVLGGSDLLLGVDPGRPRRDRTAELSEGSTLLLYTDGLIERRDSDLDRGLERLCRVFAEVGGGSTEAVCDAVLSATPEAATDDDIALLVVRCCTPG